MQALQQTLEYTFKDTSLLEQALTHPSSNKSLNNQRLEFLGDAVLGLLIAKLLYTHYPKEAEGELARRHAALVRGETLVEVAGKLELGKYLHLAGSEEAAGGRNTASNLEDACEALIGAIYLDGGIDAAAKLVEKYWQELANSYTTPPKDAKTALQEWAQGNGLPLPIYEVTQSDGPAHAPAFTISVTVQGHPPASATANSKRAAEQAAAATLLERL